MKTDISPYQFSKLIWKLIRVHIGLENWYEFMSVFISILKPIWKLIWVHIGSENWHEFISVFISISKLIWKLIWVHIGLENGYEFKTVFISISKLIWKLIWVHISFIIDIKMEPKSPIKPLPISPSQSRHFNP